MIRHIRVTIAIAAGLVVLLAPALCGAATVFALTDTGELFASEDVGSTWEVRATIPASDAAGLLALATPQDLFMASASGVVYRSQDAGVTWNAVGTISASDVTDLAAHVGGALLVLTRSGTLWRSTDSGVSFTAQGTVTASNCVSLVYGPLGDLYALTQTGEVARSTNDGATWATIGTIPVSDAVAIRRLNLDLLVLTETGLAWRSTDEAVSWLAVGTLSQVYVAGVTQVASQLVALTREGLTARSTDGAVWSWVGAMNQLNVIAVASDDPQQVSVPDPGSIPSLALAPPFPNPLRGGGALEIRFRLREDDTVRLELMNARGRRVASQSAGRLAGGQEHVISWDPGPLASGVYYLQVRGSSGEAAGQRVAILR